MSDRNKILILSAIAFVALALVMWGATFFWQGMGHSLSGHGWFAYALGGIFTLLTSIGLFFLLFFSARRGHDERVSGEDR